MCWLAEEARLRWVDIARNELYRFDVATGQDEWRTFAVPVGRFAFAKDGGPIFAMKDGLARLADWDAEPLPIAAPPI